MKIKLWMKSQAVTVVAAAEAIVWVVASTDVKNDENQVYFLEVSKYISSGIWI